MSDLRAVIGDERRLRVVFDNIHPKRDDRFRRIAVRIKRTGQIAQICGV